MIQRCQKCSSVMVEKPLFTTTYFECPWCDQKPVTIETDNNNDHEYPYWLDQQQYRMIESDRDAPCFTEGNKNTHVYVPGNGYCTCGGKEAPIFKPPKRNAPGNYIEYPYWLSEYPHMPMKPIKDDGNSFKYEGTVHGRFSSSQPQMSSLPRALKDVLENFDKKYVINSDGFILTEDGTIVGSPKGDE